MKTAHFPRLLAAGALLALTVAACGGTATPAGDTTATTRAPTTEDTTATTSTVAEASAFPVTIEHAFGETTIETEPTRVVAWGWATADALIALDVAPVGIPYQAYGGDEEGVLPWIREAIEEKGMEMPAVLPDSAEPPFEAIAALEPDLILSPYSGITEQDYDLLSQIAPTVAYPKEAWATPWREVIQIVGESVGKPAEAAQLLADIDSTIAEKAAEHPEFQGKTVAVVWPTLETFYVYKQADSRVQFIEDLGFETPESVHELGEGGETFYYTLSFEQLDQLNSDVLVAYADTEEQAQEFLSSDPAQLMPQVKSGAVASVVGTEFIASVSPPTALSLTWGLDTYVELLSEAAEAASG